LAETGFAGRKPTLKLPLNSSEMTIIGVMWLLQVSYRIGEDGSVGVIYDGQATSTTSSDSSSDIAPVSRLTPSPDATAMDARISPDTVNYQFVNSVIAARAS